MTVLYQVRSVKKMNKHDVIGVLLKVGAIFLPLVVIGLTWWAFSLHSMWLFEQPMSELIVTIQDRSLIDILVALMMLIAMPYSIVFAILWYIGVLAAWLHE